MASTSSNLVGVHYRVGKKIGEGSFGVLFEGTNILNNQQVAIKFVCPSGCALVEVEILTSSRKIEKPRLHSYGTNTEHTRSLWGAVSCSISNTSMVLIRIAGVPNVYYFGQEGLHNILVIDLLGPSLEDLFDHCNRRFSIKTVVMVAKQMVSR